jgi:hypothetical protein
MRNLVCVRDRRMPRLPVASIPGSEFTFELRRSQIKSMLDSTMDRIQDSPSRVHEADAQIGRGSRRTGPAAAAGRL